MCHLGPQRPNLAFHDLSVASGVSGVNTCARRVATHVLLLPQLHQLGLDVLPRCGDRITE